MEHSGMQGLAVSATLVIRVYEQSPNAAGLVARCKGHNFSVCLNHPSAPKFVQGCGVICLGDPCGIGEHVLAHRQAHAMHARDVCFSGLPQRHTWALTPELSRAAK